MSDLRVMLWIGGDPKTRDAKLTVNPTHGPASMAFCAIWEPGYCGCEDCRPITGRGATKEEAIADFWEQWESGRDA